jgi:hypothetical protein
MLDNIDLDNNVRIAILNLMMVLYGCGITEIHIGGVMRIMGVSDATASAHDDERLLLDEDFVRYVEQINEPRPADQTLH